MGTELSDDEVRRILEEAAKKTDKVKRKRGRPEKPALDQEEVKRNIEKRGKVWKDEKLEGDTGEDSNQDQ